MVFCVIISGICEAFFGGILTKETLFECSCKNNFDHHNLFNHQYYTQYTLSSVHFFILR